MEANELNDERFVAEKTAANCFKELVPEYVACQHNWQILQEEMLKRPDIEKTSIDVNSYLEAYEAVKDNLLLRVLEEKPPAPPAPTDQELENMSSEEYKRRIVIPEFEAAQKQKRTQHETQQR
jgi:hypothetical protein